MKSSSSVYFIFITILLIGSYYVVSKSSQGYANAPLIASAVDMTNKNSSVDGDLLQVKVKTALLVAPEVSGIGIIVEENDGTITLTGNVPTQQQKAYAMSVVSRIDGVQQIVNELYVKRIGSSDNNQVFSVAPASE
ncbi:BON domain-containing protein [Glaciecola sp. 1036]|uniref:BON domain-containing protein n=1 Tax=Alteromonadaceae TaxID=72275 RepID=UPI003D042DF3